ncbi:glycoside hydrolase family 27 protein [Acrodontium crateriforme]|uniref:Alpha-galactosidase n=1 Tax=Acrodontium crateriforme TaxID=150365 RepID=A0AAQ3M6U2_9PEZI|nr:glycoside hydrolase family 27 protein [Acrodontium crateriforme]
MAFSSLAAVSALFAARHVSAVLMVNELAVTPQMGWDNWNAFGCDVSADLLQGTAERIVEIGLKDAGYHYAVLDDCWSDGRYSNGSLKPNFEKFPNGMAAVADAMHDLGLGFGMYSDAGRYTCGQYEGSLGHEEIDAKTWASWGVDYLKYDNCYNDGQSGTAEISYNRYEVMSKALNATGRQILYSMCNWGQDHPWDWAYLIANSWRATGDIYDSFDRSDVRCPCENKDGIDCAFPGFHCSVMNIINKVVWFIHRSQPGGWNDMDGLEVGNGGMTDDEYKLHFTMWAALKSPLIMGNDIRTIDAKSYSILTNPAIIALNQDPAGASMQRRWRYYVSPTDAYGGGEIQMWSGNLAQGDYVMVLLNAANQDMHMNATLADIFVDNGGAQSAEAKGSWDLYDLWANRMPDSVANRILGANSTANATEYLYNATAKSYKEGIMANETLLMGKHIGSVKGLGTVSAVVPKHGVMAYRMRPKTASTYKRDEL